MSDGTRRFAVVAALAALVVAFRGTAQAAPTTYPIPNYNFGSPTAPDGQVKWPVPYWYPAVGDGGTGFGVWNPPASAFPTAGGNGALPGTAAGSQCYVNAATVWNNDVDICTATYDGSDAAAVATLSPNTRYTMTIAVGSPLTATVMDGQSLGFADINTAALIASHEDMYPNGWYKNGLNNGGVQYMTGFKGWGDFGDISYSISASSFIGTAGVKSGDGVILILGTGAGVCWSNVRLISQNWSPLFAAGNVTWDNNTTSAWSAKSGGPYGGKWAPGQDAVFEGGGGTVTVVESIASVNSLNFTTDCTAIPRTTPGYPWVPSYTLGGPGSITLTGDAVITVGAGTDNTNNAGGGTALISCPLGGSAGMYKAGAGNLILTGANTYTGGTTVGGGTLQIGNGGTTGSILGNVTNLANLAFNYSSSASPTVSTFSGVISNTGSVDILGSGTTIFTGNNTYTGVTTIHAGSTLQVGNSTTTGAIVGDVVNNGTLVFKRSNDVTYSGIIYDGSAFFPSTPGGNGYSTIYNNEVAQHGNLTQAGAGRLTLDNSQMLYTGTTTVQSGALVVTNASSAMYVLNNVNTTTHTGGVSMGNGFLVLDYSANPANESSLVSKILSVFQFDYNGGVHPFQPGYDYQIIIFPPPPPSIGLGWVDNTSSHQITIMRALYGDCNLDGVVGPADLAKLLTNYGKSGMTWSQGDFTYDGTIGPADLSKLLTNYGQNGPLNIGSIPALAYNELTSDTQVMQLLASHGVTITEAVPEPSSLVMLASLLAVGGTWRIRRRRRTRIATCFVQL